MAGVHTSGFDRRGVTMDKGLCLGSHSGVESSRTGRQERARLTPFVCLAGLGLEDFA